VTIRAVHICMEMFKVLFSPAYTVRFKLFKVNQKKFLEKNAFLGSADWFH